MENSILSVIFKAGITQLQEARKSTETLFYILNLIIFHNKNVH